MRTFNIFVLALSLVIVSCNGNKFEAESEPDYLAQLKSSVPPPPPPSQAADVISIKSQDYSAKEQMLIRTAYITLEVENYEASRLKIDSIVKNFKSWIASEDMQNYDYRISNYLTIRVPSANLSLLIKNILTVAKKVDSQRIESTDVTEEYIDTESRLNNQKAVEKKFSALLKQTNSIEEILKIESKLADVRGEIESLEGRIRYLNNRVSFSTINLSIYQKIDFKYTPEPMESFWERFKKSIHNGWQGLVAFFLFLIKIWPLWILAALSWWLTKKFLLNKTNRTAPEISKVKEKEKEREKDKHKDKLKTKMKNKEAKQPKSLSVDNPE